MGIRRRRKEESDLIDLVRTELGAIRSEVQTALTETAASLTVRMRTEVGQRMGEPSALVSGLQGVRDTLHRRDSELAHVLSQVVETCENLSERVQIDRIERAALVDAISRLSGLLAAAAPFPLGSPHPAPPFIATETIVGGTVDPQQAPPPPPDREIDLIAAATVADATELREPAAVDPPAARPVRPDAVEVRCRFGDRWVNGFEVCEVIRLDDRTRYRLRRRSDGSVIPTLFDEKDLRFFSTSFVEPS